MNSIPIYYNFIIYSILQIFSMNNSNQQFLTLYRTQFLNSTKQANISRRTELFTSINGDLFYSLKQWPTKMKLKFWKKPISDNDSFELFLFFIGNGGSPHIIAEWILTSQTCAEYGKMEKRARQLDLIFNSKEAKTNIWFYFDMYHSDWRFLDGTKRQYK